MAATAEQADRGAALLQTAVEVFHQTTGLQFALLNQEVTNDNGYTTDALVRLDAPGVDQTFVVETKAKLTQATLGAAIQHLERFPQKGLLVTDYVNPNMAERLKAMELPFIDLAGNAYLDEPPVYVYIKGNKPHETAPHPTPTRAFKPTGLKVVFALLCQPGLENTPYRAIAKAAGVALGTVDWVINDLKALNYLIDRGKRGRQLVNKDKLIERWATTYPEQLRPKLVLGHYRAADPYWWKQARLENTNAYWGGEVAAAKLTKYLKPERITLYTREKPGALLLANKLKKDPEGDVEILQAFWPLNDDRPRHELAPPLLIYADLLATGDTRNIETARMIYEQELIGLIREG